jgi:hypothetical protein
MARIRTIKPDAFKSDTLSSVSVLARWTFAGLWTYCDDEGRGRADARLIKAELYPIDDGTTLAHVEGALEELEGVGAICRYHAGSRTYLHIPEWASHQRINRPTDSILPGHTGCAARLTDDSRTPHGALSESPVSPPDRKGTGKGKEQGSATRDARVSESFARFWAAYPRHTDKARALKAWKKALETHDPDALVKAAGAYARSKRGTEQRFILHPSTWVNGERWDDEEAPDIPDTPRADQTEQPPDGLSDDEYAAWWANRRHA